MKRFDGRVALITGGGTGLGAAVAQRFIAEGGRAVLMGLDGGPLEAVAHSLSCAMHIGNAAIAQDVRTAISLAHSQYGRLDTLVANAGGHHIGGAAATDDEQWDDALRNNLTSAFVCVRESLPDLISNAGSILVVSSIAGLAAGPDVVGYVTTKHALIGLTRSVARDYGPRGVRINALCPGWIRTTMADKQMQAIRSKFDLPSLDEAYALVTRNVPLRRAATAAEVAGVACFLLSSDAVMMTGSVVVVDGGATAVDLPTIDFDGHASAYLPRREIN